MNVFSQCTTCQSIKEALVKPEMVKSLQINAWRNHIVLDSFPLEIIQLNNLEILYLSDHNFKTIPKEIGSFRALKELSFAGCKLESLPEEIFMLKNLQELLLGDNAFSEEYINKIKSRFKELLPGTKVFL
jgi:Leucine-rich repeat (LRR) protein